MKIEKLVFAVLIGSFITFSANAQSKTGLKFGANFTNLYVDEVDDNNMKIGFNAGLYHREYLTKNIAIQPEVLFSQKGSSVKYEGGFLTGSGTYRYNLNYLEVPVLAMIKLNNFYVSAGPYAGLLLSVNIKDVDDDGDIQEIENLDRDDFNTLDYGVAVGAGFDFDGGTFGLRYSYGMNELGKEGTFAGQAINNAKNSALQLFIGFDLK